MRLSVARVGRRAWPRRGPPSHTARALGTCPAAAPHVTCRLAIRAPPCRCASPVGPYTSHTAPCTQKLPRKTRWDPHVAQGSAAARNVDTGDAPCVCNKHTERRRNLHPHTDGSACKTLSSTTPAEAQHGTQASERMRETVGVQVRSSQGETEVSTAVKKQSGDGLIFGLGTNGAWDHEAVGFPVVRVVLLSPCLQL